MKIQYIDYLESFSVVQITQYSVRFWSPPIVEGSMPSQETWVLSETESVEEVLEWANERRLGRQIEIFAADRRENDLGQAEEIAYRLVGSDPTEFDGITIVASNAH